VLQTTDLEKQVNGLQLKIFYARRMLNAELQMFNYMSSNFITKAASMSFIVP
jgi:hypothetical protein